MNGRFPALILSTRMSQSGPKAAARVRRPRVFTAD